MSIMTMVMQAVAPLPALPQDLPVAKPNVVTPLQAADQMKAGSIFLNKNLQLTMIILVFGLLALVLLFFMALRKNDGHSEIRQFELRIFTITVLVFGSLLVAAAGFATEQLGPLIGFFGTIAGYVLGRGDRPNDPPQRSSKANESN